jgi:hypothetical protein
MLKNNRPRSIMGLILLKLSHLLGLQLLAALNFSKSYQLKHSRIILAVV